MVVKGKVVKKESALAKYLRRKISNRRKEAAGISAISFGDLIFDMARIDPRYVLGANFSRPSANISSKLKIGKQNLKDLKDPRDGKPLFGEDYLNHIHNINYSGATHEFVTDSYMRAQGVEVLRPETMNQPGWDRIYNGQPFQIKFNTVDGIREARLKNPDIQVLSDIESAAEYKKKFPEDAINVMGTTPKAVTQDIVKEGKEASMEVHQDAEFFNIGIPEFIGTASVASTIKNLFYISEKKTNTKTAVQNIAMDTAVKGPGMWMGAKIGGAILGPIGAIAGMVGGAIVAGGFLDELKVELFCEKEVKEVEKNLKLFNEETDKIFKNNQNIIKDKIDLLDMTLGSESYRKKYLKENKISAELYEFLAEKFIKEKKGFERFHLRKKLWIKKFKDYPNSEKLKTIDNFFENNIQIGIPHYFLKKESKLLLDSSEKLINAMKKRGI